MESQVKRYKTQAEAAVRIGLSICSVSLPVEDGSAFSKFSNLASRIIKYNCLTGSDGGLS